MHLLPARLERLAADDRRNNLLLLLLLGRGPPQAGGTIHVPQKV
jgi:hypothetical protein